MPNSNNYKYSCRLHKEIEELKAKLSEEKKQRNDKHVAFRNEIAHLRAENDDLKIKVLTTTDKEL